VIRANPKQTEKPWQIRAARNGAGILLSADAATAATAAVCVPAHWFARYGIFSPAS